MKGLYFLAGLLVGAAGGYFYSSNIFNKKLSDESDRLNAYWKEHYEDSKKEKAKPKNSPASKIETGEVEQEKVLMEHVEAPNKINYNRIYSSKVEEYENKMAESEHPPDDEADEEDGAPYIIDEDIWAEPIPIYNKLSLVWDADDEILIDETTDEKLEIERSIGVDMLDILEKMKSGSYIYIRNDKNSTDYEIIVRRVN